MQTTIVWFRQDLRLTDNPALQYALLNGAIVPIYIWDESVSTEWSMGSASKWWVHHSLTSLSESLEKLGHTLHILKGDPIDVLEHLIGITGATAVTWNRCYEPYSIHRDQNIKSVLTQRGVNVKTFNASLLFEPWTIHPINGDFFKMFTPFWKQCLKQPIGSIVDSLSLLKKVKPYPMPIADSCSVDALNLQPTNPNWATGFDQFWHPGEAGALKAFQSFLNKIHQYKVSRDFLDQDGTSKLSPHLHFGEISPRYLWQTCQTLLEVQPDHAGNIHCFLTEIGWREFSYHLLYHVPDLPTQPFRTQFKNFPWQDDSLRFQAWKQGKTGIPIVDAGMRELWQTGYMHNRARMIVASFLTKNVLIAWQNGEAWFWDTLLDADLANNSASWQWVAGCGADAAPYFRIFNPVLQGKKFDPSGDYVRRWVPELKALNTKYIHHPWEAPESILTAANVRLGQTYPLPIVDLQTSRRRALDAYKQPLNSSKVFS